MAKYFNNQKKTGKVAGSVFAIRHGEVIERAYNPIVSNPKSAAQTQSRAKLKLMSQLGAAFGGIVAILRDGNKSPRNIFTSINYPLVTWDGNKANINLENVTITGGNLFLTTTTPVQEGENVTFSVTTDSAVEKVVAAQFYIVGTKLRYANSVVVNATGGGANISIASSSFQNRMIYVYGIRANSQLARVKFANMDVSSANSIASLLTSTNLTANDVTLTETRGIRILSA